MFTIFLTATAAVVSAVMGGLLLRPRREVPARPLRVPYAAIGVAVAAASLVALGLWMV